MVAGVLDPPARRVRPLDRVATGFALVGPGSSDELADPVLQLLVDLTREGTVVAAFQSTHDKFHRYQAEMLQLAPSATFDDRARDELLRTLDDYAELFHEHHQAENNYFFPALREAEPTLNRIVEQLVEQHEQLAAHLAAVLKRAHGDRSGADEQNHAPSLVDDLAELQRVVDEHLMFEESTTVPVLSSWECWPLPNRRA